VPSRDLRRGVLKSKKRRKGKERKKWGRMGWKSIKRSVWKRKQNKASTVLSKGGAQGGVGKLKKVRRGGEKVQRVYNSKKEGAVSTRKDYAKPGERGDRGT